MGTPRSPRDTLDDADRQADAVHELTDPVDPLREAPTDIDVAALESPTDPLGSRELPTGPAEHRTAPWMHATPWAAPEPPPEAKKDPWFWPVVFLAIVLVASILLFVYQETHKVP